MRKIGNYGLALMTVVALGSGVGLTAHAGSVSKTVTSNFTSAWEKTATGSNGSKLQYGYNTVLINEDTAYAYHPSASHYAKIQNGKGAHTSRSSFGGQWSKLEVVHSGQTVIYSCEW